MFELIRKRKLYPALVNNIVTLMKLGVTVRMGDDTYFVHL